MHILLLYNNMDCTLTGPLLKFIAAYMLKINMIFENYQEF